METIKYPSNERGAANHGWLIAKHSFSFASWYHPDKIQFGALRVLNDDSIAPAMGFGTHPHDNMEIITIPLSGALFHKDSMGHSSEIKAGEVQVMSAGTGIQHSEYNASKTESLSLFQIWIFPNKKNVEPRYDQKAYSIENNPEKWVELVGPIGLAKDTYIHQNAWIHMGTFTEDTQYKFKDPQNGIYLMVIEGEVMVNGNLLNTRDALGIYDTSEINIQLKQNSKLLVIEVPLK